MAMERDQDVKPDQDTLISVVVPAYNEEATCVESVRSPLTLEYPEYDILVVNDGSKDGTVERLSRGGLALGVLPSVLYQEESRTLERDDLLLAYTDGLIEARDRDGSFYGIERTGDPELSDFARSRPEFSDIWIGFASRSPNAGDRT